jgi:Signal transduction histidine kinase
VAGKNAD